MRTSLLSILLVSGTTVFCQGSYPLHLGNRWEYWEPPPPPNFYAWTTRAVSDTIMPNNLSYVLLRSDGGLFDQFFRQDGPRVYEFLPSDSSEYVLYDFSRAVGDTVSIRYYPNDTIVIRVTRIGNDTVCGRLRTQWEFYEQATRSSFFAIREVTDSIGMTRLVHEPGISFYLRGSIVNGVQCGIITSVRPNAEFQPADYTLFQNYPNPFNSSTIVTSRVPKGQAVTIEVFDLLGRKVKTLFRGTMQSDFSSLIWDGRDEHGASLASGIYICQLRTAMFVGSIRMALLR
jgi:hypothetical protein